MIMQLVSIIYFIGCVLYIILQEIKQKITGFMQQVNLINQDSDNDQGFIVNTIEIKHKDTAATTPHHIRPTDYQPRYILNHHIIRKEIPQIITSYPHFNNNEILPPEPLKKIHKQPLMHPDKRYINNKNHRLVYQRSNKKFDSYSQIIDNGINLSSVQNYSQNNYAMIKNWQFPSSGQELSFQSKFQCGNLQLVYKSLVEHNHYILFVHNDSNTRGYNKWFYFAVKNKKKHVNYTFSIVNFRKNFTFFKQGMRPTRFSMADYEQTGNGWSKSGKNVNFYKSQLSLNPDADINQYFTLTFDISFEHDNDLNFFSLLPPYSYSKLMNFLHETKQSTVLSHHIKFQIKTIAYSLTNTQIPYVTISGPQRSTKNIVIIARQHPGEIWSSYLAESLIQQLARQSNTQKDWLLKNYTFRIFPMVNVDGVIYGNFRCDLSGMDMNRCWKYPNKLLHPQIIQIKEEIIRLSTQQEVVCFLDFHAHSKAYNVFAYCSQTDIKGRILPFLFSRNSPLFDFSACTFGISKYKQGTARAVIFDITKATDVITIQSSFFASNNPLKLINPSSFDLIANAIIKSFKHLYSKSLQLREAQLALPKAMAMISEMRLKNNVKEQQDSGSQSQPELDEISLKQKVGKVIPKCMIIEQSLVQIKRQADEMNSESVQLKKVKKKKREKKSQIKPMSSIEIQPEPKPEVKEQKIPKITIRGKNFQNKNMILLEKVLNKMSKGDQEMVQNKKKPMIQSSRDSKQHSGRYQSLEMTKNRKFFKEEFKPEQTLREKHISKLQFQYKHEKLDEQQFPMLCVLSDRKKEGFLQKLKRIHPTPLPKEKPINRYEPMLIINKKLDTMQKLRQRQKNSNDLITSIWKETIEDSYPNQTRSIFYGGL